MKVLFQSRVDIYDPRGGDTGQMENTKRAIEKLDPTIQIDISVNVHEPKINEYDIVHLFNLDWIPETYVQAKWAKRHDKKIVLSAIHHSEDEVLRFERDAVYDIRRIYNAIFKSQGARDLGKNIYRSIFNFKKVYPTYVQFIRGIRNSQREILSMSDIVLVQTNTEAKDIQKDFAYNDFKWKKVVNGVDTDVFGNSGPDKFNTYIIKQNHEDIKDTPIILSVGRIEPRKNQLKLIEAFLDLKNNKLKNYKLVFIGAYTKRSPEYISRFKSIISQYREDIIYTGALNSDLVASAMSHKGLYVHTSWFETTGLVTIEAALCGMGVVAAGERTREYLGDWAVYCDPGSLDSIKNAIIEAVNKPFNMADIKNKIKTEYNWENTAKQTIEAYKGLLFKGSSTR